MMAPSTSSPARNTGISSRKTPPSMNRCLAATVPMACPATNWWRSTWRPFRSSTASCCSSTARVSAMISTRTPRATWPRPTPIGPSSLGKRVNNRKDGPLNPTNPRAYGTTDEIATHHELDLPGGGGGHPPANAVLQIHGCAGIRLYLHQGRHGAVGPLWLGCRGTDRVDSASNPVFSLGGCRVGAGRDGRCHRVAPDGAGHRRSERWRFAFLLGNYRGGLLRHHPRFAPPADSFHRAMVQF